MKLEISRQMFEKHTNIQIFMKNPLILRRVFLCWEMDGRTDEQTVRNEYSRPKAKMLNLESIIKRLKKKYLKAYPNRKVSCLYLDV